MRKKDFTSMIILLILIIVIAFAYILQRRLAPFTDSKAESEAQYIANKMTHEAVIKVLKDYEEAGKELYYLEKDEAGNIKAERANIIQMNRFKADLLLELNQAFSNIKDNNVYISAGNLTGIDFLANLGFKVPIRISFNGKVEMEFKDEFVSVGINQSKHNAYLHIKTGVSVSFIGRHVACICEQDITLTDTIIHGNIPATYWN